MLFKLTWFALSSTPAQSVAEAAGAAKVALAAPARVAKDTQQAAAGVRVGRLTKASTQAPLKPATRLSTCRAEHLHQILAFVTSITSGGNQYQRGSLFQSFFFNTDYSSGTIHSTNSPQNTRDKLHLLQRSLAALAAPAEAEAWAKDTTNQLAPAYSGSGGSGGTLAVALRWYWWQRRCWHSFGNSGSSGNSGSTGNSGERKHTNGSGGSGGYQLSGGANGKGIRATRMSGQLHKHWHSSRRDRLGLNSLQRKPVGNYRRVDYPCVSIVVQASESPRAAIENDLKTVRQCPAFVHLFKNAHLVRAGHKSASR